MTAAKSFADLKRNDSRARSCSRCGAEQNAGAVLVELRASPSRPSRRVIGKSVSLCEPCAVTVYEAVERTLLAESGREART